MDRIRSGNLFTVADMDEAIAKKSVKTPAQDYHTSALEKMDQSLNDVLAWTEKTRQLLDSLDEDDWRFTDRAMQEQVHSYVTMYERALDRESRVLEKVSKMALSEKIVSIGRAQVEMVISIMTNTLGRLGFDAEGFANARQILLEEFRNQGNMTDRLDHETELALTAGEEDAVDAEIV